MDGLFSRGEINGLILRNRFVRSATWEGLATDEGAATPQLADMMARLASGGVGLVITGHAYVLPDGQTSPRQLGIYKDQLISGLKNITRAVHEEGGKIVVQLAHAGFYARKVLTGKVPLAPSAVKGLSNAPRREMMPEDIHAIIQAFGQAALRAREAGFDGIQLHAAHGYLLSQFLSPRFNHRTDKYGGEIMNRVRIHIELLREIRRNVGPDYPVLIKMNCSDFSEDGLTLDDSVQAAVALCRAGIDAIELSGGLLTSKNEGPNRPGIDSEDKEAYFREEAVVFKRYVSVPLILVGGIRSYQVAENIFEKGIADYISMSRPFIREPDLINRWKSGDLRKSTCVSDNLCFKSGISGDGVHCKTKK